MSATDTNSSEQGRALWPALGAAAAVTVAAWVWFVGRAPAERELPPVRPAATAAAASGAAPAPLSASQVQRGIERAQADVKKNPQDATAWAMLAHSSEMAGRFEDATAAYRELLKLRPQDAQVHADYADALGIVQQGSLQGEPARLVARALELEPANAKALVLAGKAAFERRATRKPLPTGSVRCRPHQTRSCAAPSRPASPKRRLCWRRARPPHRHSRSWPAG